MPIEFTYGLDPEIAGLAAFEAQEDIAAADQLRYDDRVAEDARQFDERLDVQYDAQELDDYRRGQALGLQAYATDAQLGLNYDQLGIESALRTEEQQLRALAGEQQLMSNVASEMNATERTRITQMAQIKEAQLREQSEQAMAAQKAIMAYKGFTSQQQFDEVVAQWEEDFGMEWSFPERAIAERQNQDFAAQRDQFKQGFVTLSGGILTPEDIAPFIIEGEGGRLELSVKPELITGMAKARMDDKRLRENPEQAAASRQELETLKADLKAKTETPQQQYLYQAKVQEAHGKAQARYYELLTQTAKSLSTKATGGRNGQPAKTVTPDELPRETKARLRAQALLENPKPPLPPGMTQ